METSLAPGPSDSVVSPPHGPGNDGLVSKPAERGTPRAALVDALFSEDVARCRELLDAHPELVSTPLRHQAYQRVHRRDSAWGLTETTYQPVTPVVFASLVPRFREQDVNSRALSSAGLAIIALLVERGAVLEISPSTIPGFRISSSRFAETTIARKRWTSLSASALIYIPDGWTTAITLCCRWLRAEAL